MRRFLASALFFTFVAVPLSGQGGRGARAVPAAGSARRNFPFHIEEDFFKLPENIWPSKRSASPLNSTGHIFLLNRGNHPLLEFGPDGSFVGSMGERLDDLPRAHSVRFDVEDNMWLVDAGNNVVVKFTAKRRIVQALGRRLEPWVYMTHGIERAIPVRPASTSRRHGRRAGRKHLHHRRVRKLPSGEVSPRKAIW